MRLEGKVVIVTGAGQGIGAVYAHALAREGATVVAADVREDNVKAVADDVVAEGGRALAIGVDVTDEASTQAMAARVVGELGRIDALVNNAGYAVRGAVEEVGLDAVRACSRSTSRG